MWPQDFWDILCAIYRALGGDCKDLPPRPTNLPVCIDTVDTYFETYGVPTMTGPQRAGFLQDLTNGDALLTSPANTLTKEDSDRARAMFAAMRNAVNP